MSWWWWWWLALYLVPGAMLVGAAHEPGKPLYLLRFAVVIVAWPLFLFAGVGGVLFDRFGK